MDNTGYRHAKRSGERMVTAGQYIPLALFVEADVVRMLVPHVHEHFLRRIDVFLVFYLLDIDTHAILGECDVFVADILGRLRLDLVHAQVDLVANKGKAANDDEEDNEGDNLSGIGEGQHTSHHK